MSYAKKTYCIVHEAVRWNPAISSTKAINVGGANGSHAPQLDVSQDQCVVPIHYDLVLCLRCEVNILAVPVEARATNVSHVVV
jgi:hypothetical protein